MKMHDAACLRVVAVHGAMDGPGGGIDMRAHRIIKFPGIDKQHVTCLKFREMDAIGVHQKHLAIIRDSKGEVIRNSLMHVLTRCPTKDRRQITARLLDVRLINVGSSACHASLLAGLPSKPAGGNSASQRKTDAFS